MASLMALALGVGVGASGRAMVLSGSCKGVGGGDIGYSKPRKTSGDDCREVFAGLVLDEMPELTAVAGVIDNGTAGSTLFLEFL